MSTEFRVRRTVGFYWELQMRFDMQRESPKYVLSMLASLENMVLSRVTE